MTDEDLDRQFREAVALIDAGDVAGLRAYLREHPALAAQRLIAPGVWLRELAGDALDGFFRAPFLLWFVAEDPVRNGRLPADIASVAGCIIEAARDAPVDTVREQVDYALRLVCWSWIARDCGVQIALMTVLLDAGADPDGSMLNGGRYGTNTEAALYNGNFEAARHLLGRGAALTLSAALCLDRWDDVARLLPMAGADERVDAFVLAAMNGRAEALRRMLARGVGPNAVSGRNQSHGTALHHAVWSGELAAVRVLVDAGADRGTRDTLHGGTPLDWAEYAVGTRPHHAGRYRAIADFLRDVAAPA